MTTVGGSDTSAMFYPELSLDSCSNGIYIPPPIIQPSGVRNTLPIVIGTFKATPNPLRALTTVEYTLATTTIVDLVVYNILGSPVATLVNNSIQDNGEYAFDFDASDLQEGNYICSLRTAQGEVKSIQIIIQH